MTAYCDLAAGAMTAFGPVRDGVVLPDQIFSPQAVARSADKPLIVGDLDTEAALFLMGQREALDAAGLQEVTARLERAIGAERAQALVGAIRQVRGDLGGYDLAVQIVSHGLFTGPAHLACLRRDAGEGTAPTYRYRNVLRTDAADSALGSTHELDVALTFGNVEAAVGLNGGTGEARATSAVLGRAWAAFARTGVPDLGEAGPWPAWDAAERHVALLGAHPRVAQDVDGPSLDVAARLGDEQLLNWFGMLLG